LPIANSTHIALECKAGVLTIWDVPWPSVFLLLFNLWNYGSASSKLIYFVVYVHIFVYELMFQWSAIIQYYTRQLSVGFSF
jgi:hypothetical protein